MKKLIMIVLLVGITISAQAKQVGETGHPIAKRTFTFE
jgi:hypothetical protein